MTDKRFRPEGPDCRTSFRWWKVQRDALDRIAAARTAAMPPDSLGRPGPRTVTSDLIREAIENYFSLPSVDTKTDDALETVSA